MFIVFVFFLKCCGLVVIYPSHSVHVKERVSNFFLFFGSFLQLFVVANLGNDFLCCKYFTIKLFIYEVAKNFQVCYFYTSSAFLCVQNMYRTQKMLTENSL